MLSNAAQAIAAELAPKFAGPFKVTKVVSRMVYELENAAGKQLGRHHVKDLKPYVAARADNVETDKSQENLEAMQWCGWKFPTITRGSIGNT